MNLGELFVEQADEFVVLLDSFEGLDVDGLAAGAGAVNYALDAPFLLDLDGDDEAFAADGYEFVLPGAAFGEAGEISRHSAARSTTSMTSRISVVSRIAPRMRDFATSWAVGSNPENSKRPPT